MKKKFYNCKNKLDSKYNYDKQKTFKKKQHNQKKKSKTYFIYNKAY